MRAAKIPLMLLLGSVCCLLAVEPSSATGDSGPSPNVIRQAVALGLKPNDLTKLWNTRQPLAVVKQNAEGQPYTVTYTIAPGQDKIIEVRFSEPEKQPELEPEEKAEPQPEPKPQLEPKPQSETKPEPQSEPKPESETKPELQSEPQPSPATSPAAPDRLEPGWTYIPNRLTFPLDKLPFGSQTATFKTNWQPGLTWPNFEWRTAVAPMTNNQEGTTVTRMHTVSIPGAEGLSSPPWQSTNVPSIFDPSRWPFHNPFLSLGPQGTPTYVTSGNPMAQPQPSIRPPQDLDALPPLPTAPTSTVKKNPVIKVDLGSLPDFRMYTLHRSERPSIAREEPQIWNSCIGQQDLQKANGPDSSIDSSIESYLARVNLTPADIVAHNGEFVKTIVDQSGRVLSVKYVLSDVKGDGNDQGKRPENEIKRR